MTANGSHDTDSFDYLLQDAPPLIASKRTTKQILYPTNQNKHASPGIAKLRVSGVAIVTQKRSARLLPPLLQFDYTTSDTL